MRLEGDSTYDVLRNHDPKMDFMSRYHENKMDTLTRYPESKIDLLNRYSQDKSVDVFPLSPTSPYEASSIDPTTLLPRDITLKGSHVPGAGMGVWALLPIQRRTRFGPFTGIISPTPRPTAASHPSACWPIFENKGSVVHYLLAPDSDEPSGSWMRYVNTARHEQEQNIVAFQIQHDIYFEVIRDILPGQELLLWYESSYGDLLGLYRLEQLRPDSDGCYSCQICQRTFCYPYSFMMHIATRACSHSGSEVLWCDHCGMVFALPATLRSHVRTHSHERPFPCGTCPSTFAQSTALALHNQIHWYQNTEAWYNNEYKTGVSPLLSPTISSTNGIATLPAHSTTMLPNDKIFKCNKCDKAFSCNAKLERHTRVHSGIKPYTCDYCGKSFAYSTSCRRHERTHVEGKPFKCTHCQKAFSDSTNMKAHIRIHTGEKPYRCNICGREFSHSSSLKSHHRTHTGEKPFKCSHCGTCFGHLSTLRKHGMRAHGLQKRSHLQDEGQLVVKTENPNSLQTFNSPIAQPKPYPKCDGSTLPLSHVKTENTTTPLSHAKSDQLTQPLSHNRPTIAAADSSSILHVLSPEQSLT
ncbi:hypothetical protein ACHWQZ_G019121 [Mnemiopsis leidyi]